MSTIEDVAAGRHPEPAHNERDVAAGRRPGPAHNEYVIDEAELRQMSQEARRELARTLATIDFRHPLADPRALRRRRLGLLFMTTCCVGLAGWIAILVLTLPGHYTSTDWRTVWVGLDIAELAGFAATGWAAWQQRQIVIFLMVITGTLLACDAWFDVTLDFGSRGFVFSLAAALLAEFPLAFVMFASARRLVRVTVQTLMQLSGIDGQVPPLWRIPLFGYQQGGILHDPVPPCSPGDTAPLLPGQAFPQPGQGSPPAGQAQDQRGSTALR